MLVAESSRFYYFVAHVIPWCVGVFLPTHDTPDVKIGLAHGSFFFCVCVCVECTVLILQYSF